MKAKKTKNKLGLCCFFLLVIQTNVFTTTVLNQANEFFLNFIWTENSESNLIKEIPAFSLPGGTETFPKMTDSFSVNKGLIYPEIEGLGVLDYSFIPSGLIIKLKNVLAQVKNKEIARDSVTNPYVAIVSSFRLAKIPEISLLWFSRPQGFSDFHYTVKIKAIIENETEPLFMSLSFLKEKDDWYLDELTFDGTAYAQLARQN